MDIPKLVILILSFIYNYSIKESLGDIFKVSSEKNMKLQFIIYIYNLYLCKYKLYLENMKRQNELSGQASLRKQDSTSQER